ncbi:MAG: 4-alpha-glucanotransferase [Bacteroidota bacterium]
MQILFNIHFQTGWGQQLAICGNLPELGNWNPDQALHLHYFDGGNWKVPLDLDDHFKGSVEYKYIIIQPHGGHEWEAGDNRSYDLNGKRFNVLDLHDQWRSRYEEQQALYSSAFTQVLMRRNTAGQELPTPKNGSVHRFQLRAPRIGADYQMGILGSHPSLGNWDEAGILLMDDSQYPLFRADVELKGPSEVIEYKYVIVDTKTKEVITWEEGPNRAIAYHATRRKKQLTVHTDEAFLYPVGNWKGAGIAIPVFSLRTEKSHGVGEFTDLKASIDWAKQVGLKVIQVLPINDTVATHTWVDSYPYAAISVFALHPLYLNPEAIAELQDSATLVELRQEAQRLNDLPEVDYEAVMRLKSRWFKLLYDQEKDGFFADADWQAFFARNKDWLIDYAAFSMLRDRYQDVNFRTWPEYNVHHPEAIAQLADPSQAHYDDLAIHYFIQYHLHLQMLEASEYGREQGVLLKGDIPIGIYRHSVDAWVAPQLYNMNAQAGAPPDDFAVAGQNWRFPTYNWEVMAEDGYAWWKRRMQKMASYFDAYRIDHILGFFRIWQIPGEQVQGILGQFNPSLPLNGYELAARGVWHDKERLTEPYIRWHILQARFFEHAQSVKEEFLDEPYPNHFKFKPHVSTQRQLETYLDAKIRDYPDSAWYFEKIRESLYSLISEVILLPNYQSEEEAYDPRVAMHFTQSYQELDPGMKARLDEIYSDYFYHRHEDFWKGQGLTKLPPLKDATDMLVCGEDLGMVPDCVPPVMQQLGILSLEIQRMPKSNKITFAHPGDAPYLSVVSPSTHDMSGIRAWWEQDRAVTQQFYEEALGHGGGAPFFCEPWVAKEIIVQHLYSPAMWAIFPWQDLMAMDGNLRRENPLDEQINVPANPQHYWRYRMHLSLEQLQEAAAFNQELKEMLLASGRNEDQ